MKKKPLELSTFKQLVRIDSLLSLYHLEQKTFLRNQGWIQIEGPPGFSDLWEKAIRGRIYRMGTDVAIGTEREFINFPKSCRV